MRKFYVITLVLIIPMLLCLNSCGKGRQSEGLKHLDVENWADAASQFKIMVNEQPNNRMAKGLLLCSEMGNFTEERMQTDLMSGMFIHQFSKFSLSKMEKANRDDIKENLLRQKYEIRQNLRARGIVTESWDELVDIVSQTSMLIYKRYRTQDLEYKQKLRSLWIMAAAVQSMVSNVSASQDLIQSWRESTGDQSRFINRLMPFAGRGVLVPLTEELKNPESLLSQEAKAFYYHASLISQVTAIQREHPRMTIPKDDAITGPVDEKLLAMWKEDYFKEWYFEAPSVVIGRELETQDYNAVDRLLRYLYLPDEDVYPFSFITQLFSLSDPSKILGVIKTYDPDSRQFIGSINILDNLNWYGVATDKSDPGQTMYKSASPYKMALNPKTDELALGTLQSIEAREVKEAYQKPNPATGEMMTLFRKIVKDVSVYNWMIFKINPLQHTMTMVQTSKDNTPFQ